MKYILLILITISLNSCCKKKEKPKKVIIEETGGACKERSISECEHGYFYTFGGTLKGLAHKDCNGFTILQYNVKTYKVQ